MTTNAQFKSRLIAGDPLLGTFIKTPHPIVVEIMAHAGFDFLVIDAEHAPFDRGSIDAAVTAGRANNCPMLVRVPVGAPDHILAALDSGAAGVMVPHVCRSDQAETLVKSLRYGAGGRGFAGTTRAADYARRAFSDHLSQANDEVCLIAQIEDAEAVDNLEAIAATDGVDALFVGRADLAVSNGYDDFFAPDIIEMTRSIMGVKGVITGLYCAPDEDLLPMITAGSSLFVVGSEHTLMTKGGHAISKKFRALQKDD